MTPFSFTGNAGTILSHVVIPAGGRDRIRLQYASATSDKAGSLLVLRAQARATTVTATSAANQTVINAPPYLGAAANDVVVLFSNATGTGVRGVVASVNTVAGTITLNANLALALAPGDTIHLMTTRGQIPVGSTTKEVNAPTVFAVDEGPALIELDGTAACRINLVAGEFS
jgi:hypothetical protein